MKPRFRLWVAALVMGAGLLAAAQAFADPPGRVARLNYTKGSVSFRPASVDDWAPATLNYPLTTGDHLWTDPGSWAEMHIGSTAIRLAPSTAFAFLTLDDRTTQIRLTEGAVDVRVRNLDGSEQFEIDTPASAIALTRPGVYRVDVLPDGASTHVTVRYGMASVSADGPDFWVRDGETAAIYGTDPDLVSHEVGRAAAPDSWEEWCRARDEREDGAASVRYVSYEMTGYEDLDDYGSWSSIPDYGWAWRPRVTAGWAPYRYGQWRWVSPWGWTWVDEAPWGFAPFHYGRWACVRSSWYWVPGVYSVRPIYAPALVAFIGGDNWGFSIGFGRGHVGWFPLAPGEFWMPHYHASHGYIRSLNARNVNITNINITNYNVSRGTYVNRAIAGAVTAVPRDSFLGGRAVARDAVLVDSRAVTRASVIGTSAPLAPRAESLVGRRGAYAPRPPTTALDRAVVARARPAAAPVPFSVQERALQANGGRPLDDTAMARLRSETGSRGETMPVRMAGARAGVRGDPARAEAGGERLRGDQPGNAAVPAGAGSYGSGVATRRGERVSPESPRPGGSTMPGAARAETNDRPTWARPRGAEVPSGSPASYGDSRTGARARPGAAGAEQGATSRGGAVTIDRPGAANQPGAASQGEARPRFGDRTAPGGRGSSSQPAPNDRPAGAGVSGGASARPSGGDNARPSGGDNARPGAVGGARPRGGEARPAPQSRPPGSGNTATPRSGGRGGDSALYDSPGSGSPTYTNDRPASARSWSGAQGTPRSSATALPRYQSVPESRTAPQYRSESRAVPQYRSESRAVPQYRSMPDARSTPRYQSMPESRAAPQYRPESRSVPQYRAMPESRAVPQYRAMPESRAMPQYRSESRAMPQYRSMPQSSPRASSPAPQTRSSGGAVNRGGGGRQSAAPAPRSQSSGGGQAAPRGSRNRGRGE